MTLLHVASTEPARVPCPRCRADEGYLLDLDGAAYRVFEDVTDTELLADLPDDQILICPECAHGLLLREAKAIAAKAGRFRGPAPKKPVRAAPDRRGRRVGKAAMREGRHGRMLPSCPMCGNRYGFFADLDGAAYRVLEDDDDTELLSETSNLLCNDCGSIFEI